MGKVIRAGDLFRNVSEHRRAARAALERSGEPAGPVEVDWCIECAWAGISWPVVAAILRRQRARAAIAARR